MLLVILLQASGCGAKIGKDMGLSKSEAVGLINEKEGIFLDFKGSRVVDLKNICELKGRFYNIESSEISFDVMWNGCGGNIGLIYFDLNKGYEVKYQ